MPYLSPFTSCLQTVLRPRQGQLGALSSFVRTLTLQTLLLLLESLSSLGIQKHTGLRREFASYLPFTVL